MRSYHLYKAQYRCNRIASVIFGITDCWEYELEEGIYSIQHCLAVEADFW